MIKHFFIFIFSFFTIFNCSAQLINTKPIEIPVGPISFNPNFIKEHKIKRIDLTIVDKPDGSVIIDKGTSQGYEFDNEGNPIYYYYTTLNKIAIEHVDVPAVKRKGKIIKAAGVETITKYLNDTTSAHLFYDNEHRLIGKRIKTGDDFEAFYYEYNEKGQIKKNIHCKETNISENKNEFKLGVQTVLSSETYEYIALTPTQTKKQCLNDEGRIYKTSIINYDNTGNKLSETNEFIVSWMKQENYFTYNKEGNIINQIYISNLSGNVKEQTAFEIKDGILLSEKKLKNDVLIAEKSFLYDEKNELIKSEVIREHKNASIKIVKYVYGFY